MGMVDRYENYYARNIDLTNCVMFIEIRVTSIQETKITYTQETRIIR
jgi:hypothetical protein